VLISHVTKPAPLLASVAPQVPRDLCEIIDRCLAKAPADRFEDCAALRDALERASASLNDDSSMTPAQFSPASQLITDTEAQAIIGRAASLQASTGIQPRPAPVAANRDHARDAARTSGHRVGAIRDAAIEAGIDSKYVDHALVERGLVERGPAASSLAPAAKPELAGALEIHDQHRDANAFLGTTSLLQLEVVLDGEMPDHDFDLLVDVIRKHVGESGQVSAIGRSLSWYSSPDKGSTHVAVLPRNGKTVIRVSESLRNGAGRIFAPLTGGTAAFGAPLWTGIAVHTGAPLAAALLWATTVGIGYLGARLTYSRYAERREANQRLLIEELAKQARESIAAGQPGAAPRPSLPRGR
jgi:hypothetical protein